MKKIFCPKPAKGTEMRRQLDLRTKKTVTNKKEMSLAPLMERYTVDEIAAALRRNFGTLTYTCYDLDCTQGQLRAVLATHPDLQQAREEARDSMVDLAEKKLMEVIDSGNVNGIIFALKTMGARRGWAETQQFLVGAIPQEEQKKKVQEIFGLPDEPKQIGDGL